MKKLLIILTIILILVLKSVTYCDILNEKVEDISSTMSETNKIMKYMRYFPLEPIETYSVYVRSKEIGIDELVMFALIKCESEYKPYCIGDNGTSKDYSLMQVNNRNFKWVQEKLCKKNMDIANNTLENIEAGFAIFNFYYKLEIKDGFKNRELLIRTLNSYNMGRGGYRKYRKTHRYDEWYYANKVLRTRDKIEKELKEME